MACRVNAKRVWVHRLMLERTQHADCAFVTLTYSDHTLPFSAGGLATLVPEDLQLWLKRYRKAVAPARVRFFAVGEYGDTTFRPHYHVALFGVPSCSWGQSRYDARRTSCCPACDQVRDTWGLGQVFLGSFESESANYIAGYVMKKMTSKDDQRLGDRFPEFRRSSNRPGIGADAMHEVASTLLEFDLVGPEADVPSALRHGSRLMPLGRYLTRKLREYSLGSPDVPEVTKRKRSEEMLALQADSIARGLTPLEEQARRDLGRLRQVDARLKLKPRGNGL